MNGRRLAWLAAAGGVLCLTGCGSSAYTYVASGDKDAAVRVPAAWTKFDEKTVEGHLYDSGSALDDLLAEHSWSVGFDAAPKPSLENVLGLTAERPAVYVSVRDLDATSHDSLSLDAMRDLFLPVTDDARQQYDDQGLLPTGFALLDDQEVSEHGLHGVRVTFSYDIDGDPQTFEEKVLTDADTTKVWSVFAHCSTTCFDENEDELDDIVGTFVARG